ncbi:MAG: hypothetical protein SGI92_25775 [Bryobacteraceae bacterium]|nr:hypothetical protein [Bryobacteraceae bacterium]
MKSKHSSDETLLALTDGELSVVRVLQTRVHLQSCWECRARLSRLEATAQSLAEARLRSNFLSPGRVETARARFLDKVREEAPPPAVVRWSSMPVLGRRGLAFAAAAMLSLAAIVTVWRQSEPVPSVKPRSSVTVPRAAVKPARPVSTPRAIRHEASPVASPLPHTLTAPPAALGLDQEVAVWWMLHETGACRGDEVHVERRLDKIYLTGIVSTDERRQDLLARAGALDFEVAAELRTPTDAPDQPLPSTPRDSAPAERVLRVSAPGEPLVREWLREQKVDNQKIGPRTAEIANASVRAADVAWTEAFALEDLRSRFGPGWHQLSEVSRASVLAMMRAHWRDLQRAAVRQREALAGVVTASQPAEGGVFEAVQQWNQAVQQLFAPAEPVRVPTPALVGHLSAALANIENMPGDDVALAAFARAAPAVSLGKLE